MEQAPKTTRSVLQQKMIEVQFLEPHLQREHYLYRSSAIAYQAPGMHHLMYYFFAFCAEKGVLLHFFGY